MSGVPRFWVDKYEREARKNWDRFYKRHETRFFKDRRWIMNGEGTDGFEELMAKGNEPGRLDNGTVIVLEVGSGVGNSVFPVLEDNPNVFCHAMDFSDNAIALLKADERFRGDRCNAFVWDISEAEIPEHAVPPRSCDFALCCFFLSAIPPEKQRSALSHIQRALKPDGKLLFRDYASGDLAEKRFAPSSQMDTHYFVRQDGTLSYFFDRQSLSELANYAGFTTEEVHEVERVVVNRKEEKVMHRRFLTGRFKPRAVTRAEYRSPAAPAKFDSDRLPAK